MLNRHNCTGCHVLEMPKFTIPAGTKVAEAFTDFKANLRTSYNNRANDFLAELYPGLTYDPTKKLDTDADRGASWGSTPDDGSPITIEGMPTGLFENEVTVQLWQPVTIRGYTFNVGDNVDARPDQGPEGARRGRRLRLAVRDDPGRADRLARSRSFWNRLPPPLLREGNKVQTPWLTAFLKDPYAIRPAVQLRMPRFHYGKSEQVPEPARPTSWRTTSRPATAPSSPTRRSSERTPSYLADRSKAHPNYLGAGWEMMTNKASPCLQCHAIGPFKPTGSGPEIVNGPDLRQVAPRFRPGYLEEWIANPRRLVPYTAMPQNIAPHGAIQMPVPKTFENQPMEMVRAIRDTLLNYVDAVELQLAGGGGPKTTATDARVRARPSRRRARRP